MVLAVPVPANGVAGTDISAAFWNAQVRDSDSFLIGPPHCVMYQTAAQSIANATLVALTFDTNEVDSYSGHSTVTNTSRYVAQVAGWYQCSGVGGFAANVTSFRLAGWFKNGTAVPAAEALIQAVTAAGVGTGVTTPTREIFLNVGDYVELFAEHNSGGALNTATSAGQQSMATIRWVHS